MNIRHECPMPDLSYAVAAPLLIQAADGTILTCKRWSLAGLWIDPKEHSLIKDTTVAVPFQGVDVSFPIELAATDDPEHFTFKNLTVRQREILASFHQGVLSGKMVATKDIITSLDTPVDLVPMGETAEEKSAGVAKAPPRFRRILWNLALYSCLALFLVMFIGGNIFDRLSTIELEHGRFLAPIEQYAAPDTGYIDRLYVRVGETVERGDIIARLEDPDRESDVEEVRAEVLLAERKLTAAEERLHQHVSLKPTYRAPLVSEYNASWRELRDHHPNTMRYAVDGLHARTRLQQFDGGMDLEPQGYYATHTDLERQAQDQALILKRWKRELRHRKSAANNYVIRAKTNGTIFAMHVEKGHFVGRGDLIAEIEENTPRTAVGWLDDSMATSVSIGMQAEVQFNFRGEYREMSATVVDLQAGTDAVRPDKFGMVVTLKVDEAGLLTSRKLFRPNAPARLELDRNLLGDLVIGDNDESS